MDLTFNTKNRPLHVLCLGAHCDDIEIGCGATILKLADEAPDLSINWVVFSSNEVRAAEAKESFRKFSRNIESAELKIFNFRNGYFPYIGNEIKDSFEELKSTADPDLIFTHHGQDYHQDHRTISELTWNTFRDHCILEYEIPKYDGDLGTPNFYVPSKVEYMRRKSQLLLDCFTTQRKRPWFSQTTFDALMRLRGIECNSSSGFAEAFFARKVTLS